MPPSSMAGNGVGRRGMDYCTWEESLVNADLLGCVMQWYLHSSSWSLLWFSRPCSKLEVLKSVEQERQSRCGLCFTPPSAWMKYLYFLLSQWCRQTGSKSLAPWRAKCQCSFPVGLAPEAELVLLSGTASDLMAPGGWYWLVQVIHKSDNPPVDKEELTTAL